MVDNPDTYNTGIQRKKAGKQTTANPCRKRIRQGVRFYQLNISDLYSVPSPILDTMFYRKFNS